MTNSKEMIKKIAEKTGKSEEEIEKSAKEKKEQLGGMITIEGALAIIGNEAGIKFDMNPERNNIEDEIEIDEDATEIGSSVGEEELTLEDLGKKFIKSPVVGEEVEFTLKKIKKSKNIDAVTKDGKKFKTNLTSVDYKLVYVSADNEEFSPKSWEVCGKINAICRKIGKIDGNKIKVKHIKDGMKEKEGDNYLVKVKIGEEWKTLDRKSNEWK